MRVQVRFQSPVGWKYRETSWFLFSTMWNQTPLHTIKPPQTTISSLWPKDCRILGHGTKDTCTIQVMDAPPRPPSTLHLHENTEFCLLCATDSEHLSLRDTPVICSCLNLTWSVFLKYPSQAQRRQLTWIYFYCTCYRRPFYLCLQTR